VAKFEVEVLEKAFISVKKTLTSLLFTVDQKFHFATSLKFLSPSSGNYTVPVEGIIKKGRKRILKQTLTSY
jgi:hypothetical protein